MSHIEISIWESQGQYQLHISKMADEGFGTGYRIAGPKFIGDSTPLLKHRLTPRDATEIRHYLDQIELTLHE